MIFFGSLLTTSEANIGLLGAAGAVVKIGSGHLIKKQTEASNKVIQSLYAKSQFHFLTFFNGHADFSKSDFYGYGDKY